MVGRLSRVALVALVFVSALAFAQSGGRTTRADFKGARLGMTLKEYLKVNDGYFDERYYCDPAPPERRVITDTLCQSRGRYSETIAGVHVTSFVTRFYNDELVAIHMAFRAEDFGRIANALTARFGTPSDAKKTMVENEVGGRFQNEQRTWNVGPDYVMLEKYGEDLTEGRVGYLSKRALAERAARERRAAQKNKKDL